MISHDRIRLDVQLSKYLPPAAVKKLRTLRQRADDLNVARIARGNELTELQTMAARAKSEVERLDEKRFIPVHEERARNFKAPVDVAKDSLAQILDELERTRLAYSEQSTACGDASRLANAYEEWAKSLRTQIPAFSGAVEAKILKGESPQDAIERRRRRYRELVAELESTKAAPVPSADAKKAAREQVAALSERGKPGVFDLLQYKGGQISWPNHASRETIIGHEEALLSTSTHPDGLALLAYVMPDALIAACDREIDRLADDAQALDDAARAARLQTILEDQLAVQREEEALIERLEAAGIFVARRPDADPHAVLGLAAVGRGQEQQTSEVAA